MTIFSSRTSPNPKRLFHFYIASGVVLKNTNIVKRGRRAREDYILRDLIFRSVETQYQDVE